MIGSGNDLALSRQQAPEWIMTQFPDDIFSAKKHALSKTVQIFFFIKTDFKMLSAI